MIHTPPARILLDLGTRSAKAYFLKGESILEKQTSWDLLDDKLNDHNLEAVLLDLISLRDSSVSIFAIGTEAMRRHQSLEKRIIQICRSVGIGYRTLNHHEEAILIRDALPEFKNVNIVNAGGGSIQIIVAPNSEMRLLSFGITDLNRRFRLNDLPEKREIQSCIDWIEAQLPELSENFVYTGGEEKYLRAAGVSLQDGICKASDFKSFSRLSDTMPIEELKALTPFDSEWMTGAIASNCIVRALLSRSRSERFIASDLNIAHGLAKRLLRNGFNERFD